jgi:hypothetical protein
VIIDILNLRLRQYAHYVYLINRALCSISQVFFFIINPIIYFKKLFDFYSDNSTALKGSGKLKGLKSVAEIGKEKGNNPLPENESVTTDNIVKLRKGLKLGQVREGRF